MNDHRGRVDRETAPPTQPSRGDTLTQRQIWLLAVAVALFVISAIISYRAHFWHGYIDLQVYRNGGRAWLDGTDLYGPMPEVMGIGLPFTYPPLAALFFAPLALIPLAVAEVLVLVSSIAALGATLWVVLGRVRPRLSAWSRLGLVLCAVSLLQLIEPLRQNFSFGQINLVLMLAITLDCLVRKPWWPRGLLIGIAVSVKLTPAAYLLYFLVRKDWKGAATVVAATIGAIAVGWVISPRDSPQYWFHTLVDTGRIGPPWFAGNQSIKGFAFRLGLADQTATLLWLGLSVIAVLLAAIWMRRLFSVGANAAALMVNAGTVLLVSPVSWSHHWVWIAPAAIVAIDAAIRGRRSWPLMTATAAALVVFAIGPHWLLPHEHDLELTWTWWQQIVGNSYALITMTVFIIAAISYRPTPRNA